MTRLPRTGARDDANPHIVIVGAGGSLAACPEGDKNGRRLPVMADLIDTVGLRPLLERAGAKERVDDFEAFYSDLAISGEHDDTVTEIEATIRDYFQQILIPETTTVYDYLLLSLRPKDLIATFNWDPLLAQAFRRHEGQISMPQLAFLHGNVAVGFCEEHRKYGWHDDHCGECGEPFSPSPLLFPVKEKDYDSRPSIRSQWKLLERELEEAYFVTVLGYSAPKTDAEARDAMLQVWSKNEAREIAEVELIDIRPEEELVSSWNDFIVGSHHIVEKTVLRSYSSWHPRRSCDALFAATMMNDPWEGDWIPKFEDPVELREWVDPLYEEEIRLRGTGEKFSGRSCSEWHRSDYGSE